MTDVIPELVSEIDGLIAGGRTIEAIKRLRAATCAPLDVCKAWVDERIQGMEGIPRKPIGPPCPFCGNLLRTTLARQCFDCGMDWHDANNPIQHEAVSQPNRQQASGPNAIECDDEPVFVVYVTEVGDQPAKVFSLLRQCLQVDPSSAKELLVSSRIQIAQGPRMIVESVARQFQAAGAKVEWSVAAPEQADPSAQ